MADEDNNEMDKTADADNNEKQRDLLESEEKKSTDKYKEFDDVFESHVRSFGIYQRILFIGLNLVIFPMVVQFDSLVYALGTPAFHCDTPNVTCPVKKCCDNCTTYVFDGPYHSTVSEWNLICDKAYLGATLQSCYFAGMLIGSFFTGMVSDAFGRKICMFLFFGIMLVAGVTSTFVDCVSFFGFLRFLVGFGLSGTMLSQYVYCMEIVGPKRRTLAGYGTYVYWGFFGLTAVLFAYFIRDWRTLLLVTTLPAVLLFPFWKWVPESPRWLVANGRLDEARAVLVKFGGKKNKTLDEEGLRSLIEQIRKDQLVREQHAQKHTAIDLVRTPKLRRWTFNLCYQWFSVALVNFGVFIFVSQLAGNLYVNYAIMRTLTLIRVPPLWYLTLKFGRRIIHGFCMILVGVDCLIILAFYKDYPMVTTALSVMGYLIIYCTWTTVYLMTAELFPTVLRNTAQGIGSTSARIGAILAPYIALSGNVTQALPAVIFGVVALIAGVATYWIPETLFANMYQTTEEAEAAQDDYRILCCGRPLKGRPLEQAQDGETGTPLMKSEPAFV